MYSLVALRFDFNDKPLESPIGTYSSAPSSATFPSHLQQRTVFLSPPASPCKKTRELGGGGDGNRTRRPMNGFMLFAKHHRLRLIQQFPGMDNRYALVFSENLISCLFYLEVGWNQRVVTK